MFGAQVVRFGWLFRLVAERAGYAARIASDAPARADRGASGRRRAARGVLAESARPRGFARAAPNFVAELGRARVEPEPARRARSGLGAGRGPARLRRRGRRDLPRLPRGARGGRAGRRGAVRLARARRATRGTREPGAARRSSSTASTTSTRSSSPRSRRSPSTAACDVTVSLPFEPGREAFKAIAEVARRWPGWPTSTSQLEAVSDHYAADSRAALHHLERVALRARAADGRRRPARRWRRTPPAASAPRWSSCGAEVLRAAPRRHAARRRGGRVPRPRRYASLVEQVFDAYGIPFSIGRRSALAHTGLGRGLLALLRCATLDGAPARGPALLPAHARACCASPELADRLEAEARARGARTRGRGAGGLGGAERDASSSRRSTASARRAAPGRLLEELDAELQRLFAGPYRRAGARARGQRARGPARLPRRPRRARQLHALAESLDRPPRCTTRWPS